MLRRYYNYNNRRRSVTTAGSLYSDPPAADLPETGYLQVGTFINEMNKPAPDSVIKVTTTGENPRIIDEIITDSSGQTPVLNLPAPPLEYSQKPDMPKPYSEYNVIVSSNDMDTAIINGVQVFPDSTTLQNVNLNPLTYAVEAPEVIKIPAPTLYGNYPQKIAEDDVKPLPEETGFVVLPEPVIPEFIVVHNGAPTNASATNYYVPFKDYIKNVASCEIYSTWPDATLRANILAIISLTLNRVYTEWYRSKGYNFTLTNSTAYDQAFIYGRNIFKEISLVVDDIFNTYITKPNIRQPLFTQYCDGKRVTCPKWMSQWGSKDLGDKGYIAIDILKHYYGSDIYLMNAQKVEGVPSSYPGAVLQVGSSGPNVTTIQEQLNAISNNYPAISKLKADGVYGQSTRAAVEKFQQIFNLPSTGIVDFATWYKISQIFVGVTKIAEHIR